MQKVAEAYTAETGVKLNWVSLEEGVLREQVTSDTATGGGQYDIINIGMQEAPIWGAAGWIEPLSFSADYDVDDILPAMRAGLSHDGTLYAAPFYGESSMVMYRKDLTDAAGVTIGDNDSWDNVKKAVAAIHDPDNGVYGACLRGKPGWGDNGAFITTVANSFGAAWLDADGRPQLDSPEWNAAVNFYVDLLSTYGPPGSEGNSFNEILALGSPNAEASKQFIEWATSKDYVQAVGNHPDFGWGKVPTGQRASTYALPEFQAVAGFAAAEMAAIDSAAPEATDLKPYQGVQFVAIPEFPEIGSAFGQEMAAALSGAKTVEAALAAAQEAATSILREAGYF